MSESIRNVDILTILGRGRTILKPVLAALERQGNVALEHYIIDGAAADGQSRIEAIVSARNRAKETGTAYFAMFLDDDIMLPANGVERLVDALGSDSRYAAMGIDYQRFAQPRSRHVAMGATMFVRPVLERTTFRSEENKCECQCCCDDIRGMGYLIDYLPGVYGIHLKQ